MGAQAQTVYTFDNRTGLEWMYLQSSELAPWESLAHRTDGLRLATAAEVATFFDHQGIVGTSGSASIMVPGDPFPEVHRLQQTWGAGVWRSAGPTAFVNFYVAGSSEVPEFLGRGSLYAATAGFFSYFSASASDELVPFRGSTGPTGAALVREVPEPTTTALLLMGLGAVAFAAKRTRN
jgi:PEP-CTERM motif